MKKILLGILGALTIAGMVYAGTVVKPNTFVTGTAASATEVNADFDTLYTLVNGNIDNANVKGAAGIVASKIAPGTFAAGAYSFAGSTITNSTLTAPIINGSITGTYSLDGTVTINSPTINTPTITGLTLTSPTISGTVSGGASYTSPIITTSPTAAGATWTDLGTVTTADINAGTFDGVVGGTVPAAGSFTTLKASSTSIVPLLVPGQVQNLSWSKSGSTITIASADGTALSSTNPGWVCVSSILFPTNSLVLSITSNVTFNDASAGISSDIVGMTFGETAGVAWADSMPMFIYVVNTADTSAGLRFALSRNPAATDSPSSLNNIGYKGSGAPGANSKTNFWLIYSNNTSATAKPAALVGAIYTTSKSASDDWTFPTGATDRGFGQNKIDAILSYSNSMPASQNGAATGKFLRDNGGTAPTFNTNQYYYTLNRDGIVTVQIRLTGDGGTAGAGAVETQVVLPYSTSISPSVIYTANSYVNYTVNEKFCLNYLQSDTAYFQLNTLVAFGASGVVTNNSFTAGARDINTMFSYKAF
jgi:hypothetical protein